MKNLSIGERITLLRNQFGLTQAEVAKELGVGRSYISKLEKSGEKDASKKFLARLTYVEANGILPEVGSGKERGDIMRDVQIIPLPRQIPILSYAQMGALTSYEELPHDFQQTFPTDIDDPKAFGLTLRGDSMEPDYKEGSIAILRPSSEPQQHHPVAARLVDGSVVFKIYTREKDTITLRSVNPAYDPIRRDASEVSWIYPVDSVHRIIWK